MRNSEYYLRRIKREIERYIINEIMIDDFNIEDYFRFLEIFKDFYNKIERYYINELDYQLRLIIDL